LAAIAVIGVARMPSHSFFKIQRIGLALFAALLGFIALLLLVIAVAGRSRMRAWRPDSAKALTTYIGLCSKSPSLCISSSGIARPGRAIASTS
jgi:hypothetical protein